MQEAIAENPSRRIGKYEVLGELGHGGMAVVYRARDTQLLREVAIKVLHPHLANEPESRKRFLREAQAAARLRHPNIVEVFDFSVEGDRESFMVSELLEGPTLRKFVDLHPSMPAEVAACIGIVLCDALECAHAQGVVHRDVKPDNILLHRGGGLKLTDFGIAHVADGNGMTVTGQVLGSPAHMAPEQIEGRAIDARADLFAAGTVLYVLGVGRLPFEAPYPHALLRKILDAEYPDPLRTAPVIGHRYAEILRRCMERLPERRYANAGELRDALKHFVAEVGWDQPAAQLKKYFENPEVFAEAHKRALLEKLPELGAKARKAGKLPDALGYFNRALALDPTNPKVLALVRGMSRRRRAKKVAMAGGVVLAAAALSAWGVVALVKRGPGVRAANPPVVLPESAVVVSRPAEPVARQAEPVVRPAEPVAMVTDAGSAVPTVSPVTSAEPVRNVVRASIRVATALPANARVAARNGAEESGNDAGVSTPRAVNVVFGGGAELFVDGRHVAARRLLLSPGSHSFQFRATNSNCTQLWHRSVEAGEGEQRIALTASEPCWNSGGTTARDPHTTVAAP